MPDIFDTLAPEQTDQTFAEPTGDIFDQIAPEGGKPTGDIFDQISPEPATATPQTESALATLSDIYQHGGERLTKLKKQLYEPLEKEHPYVAGAIKAVAAMIPSSAEEVKQMTKIPMPVQEAEQQLKYSEELGKAWRGEYGPVEQAATITGTALQAAPLIGLPFAKSPLRAGPADLALVERMRQAQAEVPPTEARAPTAIEQQPIAGGETYAIEPSTTQVETPSATLGVKEGTPGEVAGAGRSYYAEREAQGAEAGGVVPPEEPITPTENPAKSIIPEGKVDYDILDSPDLGLSERPKDVPLIPSGQLPEGTVYKSVGESYYGNPPSHYAFTPEGLVYSDKNRGYTHGGMSPWVLEYKTKWYGQEPPVIKGAEAGGAVPQEAVEPAAAGAQPPPEVGISQARTEAELGPGSVEPGVGAEMGSGIAFGREYINKGGDPRLPIRRANTSGLVGKNEVGIVHAELERLRGERNAAAQLLEANPDNPTVRAAFDAADAAQRAWRKELQPVLTKASDALKEAHAQSMPDADPATYQGLADLMDEHFKGQREVTPEMRTKMAKAAKGVKEVRDIANGEMRKVEDTLTRKLPKGKKVMTPEELDADLRSELENQFKDCVLS